MLSKTLRIVPLLALGAMAPNLQEARSTAVPVERVQPMHQDGEALAAKVKVKKKIVIKRSTLAQNASAPSA